MSGFTITDEWRSFAAAAFPGAPAEMLERLETAFYSGARALQRLHDGLAEACAESRLDEEAAIGVMTALRQEIEDFGERRAAELGVPMESVAPPPAAADLSEPVAQDRLDAVLIYNRVLGEALVPLMAGKGKPGLAAARIFFLVRQKDGSLSGAHSGFTADAADGEDLKTQIPLLLDGQPDYAQREQFRQPKKS